MRKTRIYYGMSGSFKGSTISWLASTGNYDIVWSGIKPWRKFESELGLDYTENLRFGVLQLTQLQLIIDNGSRDVIVERGATDIAFFNPGQSKAQELAHIEDRVLSGTDVERVLLVQRNHDFIRSVVLSEPYRACVFPGGLQDYLDSQERYIEFTKRHNNIDNVIEIECPEKYLQSIGQTLNNRY